MPAKGEECMPYILPELQLIPGVFPETYSYIFAIALSLISMGCYISLDKFY